MCASCAWHCGSAVLILVIILYYYIPKTRNIPNSAADVHQQGPDDVCSHTIRFTTMMYFNQLF